MQNKANFLRSQVNVNLYNKTDYEEKSVWTFGENKPNSKPIQTQTKPIAERIKLMQSVYLQRIMKKNANKGYEKTKPKQSQSKPILERRNVICDSINKILQWGHIFRPTHTRHPAPSHRPCVSVNISTNISPFICHAYAESQL
jgi:hypothetical protein